MTQGKLKPEIKAQWLADLRSGEFVQGRGRLRMSLLDGTHEYCCLGVLVHRTGTEEEIRCRAFPTETTAEKWWEVLPSSTSAMFNPKVRMPNGDLRTLSAINDGNTQTSFKEIADLIEQQL